MSTLADWHVVGPIAANDSTVDLWRPSSRHIWRIRCDDGALTAPGQRTAQRNGTLLRRDVLPGAVNDQFGHVRTQPLSTGPL